MNEENKSIVTSSNHRCNMDSWMDIHLDRTEPKKWRQTDLVSDFNFPDVQKSLIIRDSKV